MRCPFCIPNEDRVFVRGERYMCIWDGYPVTDGHALVVPTRHFSSWFEATPAEQQSLLEGIEQCRNGILSKYQPMGFNIGINVGEAAGQTVPHMHIHVIPRYHGDVVDPRGGVRDVIPDKGNYLKDSSPSSTLPEVGDAVISGSDLVSMLETLAGDFAEATQVHIAVAFVTESGLEQLQPYLIDVLVRGGNIQILTGDYLDVTEPNALRRMLDWMQEYESSCQIRVFQTSLDLGFHAKAYILRGNAGQHIAHIGSSNLTKHGLRRGIEWNQRLTGAAEDPQIKRAQEEFEYLFAHPNTRALSQEWLDTYTARRKLDSSGAMTEGFDLGLEIPPEVPEANDLQKAALEALEVTREQGNRAGLVVMATGLGKTWLAAFDSVHFAKVLFVAHREEILNQAQETFRKIRPSATFGRYGGGTYEADADVLFASIQTLGRQRHLDQFAKDQFDYIVVDEFHHATARTYRRLIDCFNPKFLLGLTATPERTDGGDLLGLCGENLVYRCDLHEGITQELLSPFHYLGVPDDIDFTNIPWRNGRFDPTSVEAAVATNKRAANAYAQWQKHGQSKTLAFCVSQRHADFMAEFFVEKGVVARAVHSGANSAPRTQTLADLGQGNIDVVFAVDMLNEGVDVPEIDTVMMLRPTESKILWLQQLGRGLRKSADKAFLKVIDFIGNHRTFLNVPMLLLAKDGATSGEVARALLALERGELELPPGCEVVYELEALNILKELAKPSGVANQIVHWYRTFTELNGRRPLASEAWREGYDPSRLRVTYGSWLGFVNTEAGLSEDQQQAFLSNREFFESLETTQMTKSYKMVTLLAMIGEGQFPGSIHIERLTNQVMNLANRTTLLREDFGDTVSSHRKLKSSLVSNPIDKWVEGKGMNHKAYFSYREELFSTGFEDESHQDGLAELTQEICDYRLAKYLQDLHGETRFAESIVCKVSHSSTGPMLFLPSRDDVPGIPMGATPIVVDGEAYNAKFVKIAVNVIRRQGSDESVTAEILRSFFGPTAGDSGTSQQARFVMRDGVYHLEPMVAVAGPVL